MARINVNNGVYFLLLLVLYLVFPLASCLVAFLFPKRGVSQFFMVAFSFYFGYQLGPILDLFNHYNNYLFVKDLSFEEIFTNPIMLYFGKEPYHVLFKYFLGLFDASDRVFAGTACAIYTGVFILFIRQLKPIWKYKMTTTQILALFLVIVAIDYYWYVGLRFWTGAFFMMIFYAKYVMTNKPIYLPFVLLGYFFHYVLLFVAVVLITSYFLRNRRVLLLSAVGISYFYKFIDYGFLRIADRLSSFGKADSGRLVQEAVMKEFQRQNEYFREGGNVIYLHRTDYIFFSVVLIILTMMMKNRSITKQYPVVFAGVCLMLIAANFGYSEYVFYTRIYKMVGLLIAFYLFLLVSSPQNLAYAKHSLFTKIVLVLVSSFCLLISIVQLRAALLNVTLWLGNFLLDVPIVDFRHFI